jgi:hypothetical protein
MGTLIFPPFPINPSIFPGVAPHPPGGGGQAVAFRLAAAVHKVVPVDRGRRTADGTGLVTRGAPKRYKLVYSMGISGS